MIIDVGTAQLSCACTALMLVCHEIVLSKSMQKGNPIPKKEFNNFRAQYFSDEQRAPLGERTALRAESTE